MGSEEKKAEQTAPSVKFSVKLLKFPSKNWQKNNPKSLAHCSVNQASSKSQQSSANRILARKQISTNFEEIFPVLFQAFDEPFLQQQCNVGSNDLTTDQQWVSTTTCLR